MTNYIELADRIAEYRAFPNNLSYSTLALLAECESTLRLIPVPETPSKVCWLAADRYCDDVVGLYLYESDPQFDGEKEFKGIHPTSVEDISEWLPDLAPGQKCRVTFGPVIDCNPPKEQEKSLGQVSYEAMAMADVLWSDLHQSFRDTFEKRAAAVVAEHERMKNHERPDKNHSPRMARKRDERHLGRSLRGTMLRRSQKPQKRNVSADRDRRIPNRRLPDPDTVDRMKKPAGHPVITCRKRRITSQTCGRSTPKSVDGQADRGDSTRCCGCERTLSAKISASCCSSLNERLLLSLESWEVASYDGEPTA